ncbi:MAG: serine/threonine-protein kinase RsbW [Deferribacteres bacterium]|jgi:anti-sigma regulatory factor (Ser/Thr protein kinase)|nr:putative anti-sigma regulatory factor, serine/threonine protein kinase [Deferribacteraceae bacterium]MDK2792546.1 serine/threonine-protein kinase RsbW [Deferribacteres bacterium]
MKLSLEITLKSQLEILKKAGELIESCVKAIDEEYLDAAFYLNLAVTEALSNAIKYGGKKEILLKINIENNSVKIDIIDKEGKIKKHPAIKKASPGDESGRGLYIISKIVDKMQFSQIENGTIFSMEKILNRESKTIH